MCLCLGQWPIFVAERFLCAHLLAISTGIWQISLPWFCFDQQIYNYTHTQTHTNSTGRREKNDSVLCACVRACEIFSLHSAYIPLLCIWFLRNRLKYLLNTCGEIVTEKHPKKIVSSQPNNKFIIVWTKQMCERLQHALSHTLSFPFAHLCRKLSKKITWCSSSINSGKIVYLPNKLIRLSVWVCECVCVFCAFFSIYIENTLHCESFWICHKVFG